MFLFDKNAEKKISQIKFQPKIFRGSALQSNYRCLKRPCSVFTWFRHLYRYETRIKVLWEKLNIRCRRALSYWLHMGHLSNIWSIHSTILNIHETSIFKRKIQELTLVNAELLLEAHSNIDIYILRRIFDFDIRFTLKNWVNRRDSYMLFCLQ